MIILFSGHIPEVSDGIIDTTACINQDRECCVSQLDIKVTDISILSQIYISTKIESAVCLS